MKSDAYRRNLAQRLDIGRRALLTAALGLGAAGLSGWRPAAAATVPAAAALSPGDTADLQRIAAYLSGIRTMIARFRQVSGNGATTAGTMWVERPGRMRFEYDPPNPITLIADRFYVYYWDKQLQEVQQVGLKSTPAWFLLRDPVTFSPDSVVTAFQHAGSNIRVTVVERAQPDAGSLTMDFADNPVGLRQWTIIDAQNKLTTVALSDQRFGMALDPKLFQYEDPYAAARRQFQQQ